MADLPPGYIMAKKKKSKDKIENGVDGFEPDTQTPDADSEEVEIITAEEAAETAIDDESALDILTQQLDELKDQNIRLAAELENVRKRNTNELAKARKFAVDRFAVEMLDVIESIEKASEIGQIDNSPDALEAMREGMNLMRRQMLNSFEKFGIAEIAPQAGDAFDSDRHQALGMQPSDDIAPNHILDVIRKGYSIHERLLRPAMVIVASAPVAETESIEESGDGESVSS